MASVAGEGEAAGGEERSADVVAGDGERAALAKWRLAGRAEARRREAMEVEEVGRRWR